MNPGRKIPPRAKLLKATEGVGVFFVCLGTSRDYDWWPWASGHYELWRVENGDCSQLASLKEPSTAHDLSSVSCAFGKEANYFATVERGSGSLIRVFSIKPFKEIVVYPYDGRIIDCVRDQQADGLVLIFDEPKCELVRMVPPQKGEGENWAISSLGSMVPHPGHFGYANGLRWQLSTGTASIIVENIGTDSATRAVSVPLGDEMTEPRFVFMSQDATFLVVASASGVLCIHRIDWPEIGTGTTYQVIHDGEGTATLIAR